MADPVNCPDCGLPRITTGNFPTFKNCEEGAACWRDYTKPDEYNAERDCLTRQLLAEREAHAATRDILARYFAHVCDEKLTGILVFAAVHGVRLSDEYGARGQALADEIRATLTPKATPPATGDGKETT